MPAAHALAGYQQPYNGSGEELHQLRSSQSAFSVVPAPPPWCQYQQPEAGASLGKQPGILSCLAPMGAGYHLPIPTDHKAPSFCTPATGISNPTGTKQKGRTTMEDVSPAAITPHVPETYGWTNTLKCNLQSSSVPASPRAQRTCLEAVGSHRAQGRRDSALQPASTLPEPGFVPDTSSHSERNRCGQV